MINLILDRVDWNILNKYVDDELIQVVKHPKYDLFLLIYTYHVKERNAWDLYTRSSRGLVIDGKGNIIARPFQKFNQFDKVDYSNIDISKGYEIFEKLDGSLGIVFYYGKESEWIVTTKGGFCSMQADEAQKMIGDRFKYLDTSYTYLFEIIFPENHIIIDYGDMRDVVLLSAINRENGSEIDYSILHIDFENIFTIVNKLTFLNVSTLMELKNLEIENKEGFVVKFNDEYRLKVKFKRYDILHRIMKYISKKEIWKSLKDTGNIDEAINNIPIELLQLGAFLNEFLKWGNEITSEFKNDFNKIKNQLNLEYNSIPSNLDRKEFATLVINSPNSKMLFRLYDGKSNDKLIWESLKPKNNINSFKF